MKTMIRSALLIKKSALIEGVLERSMERTSRLLNKIYPRRGETATPPAEHAEPLDGVVDTLFRRRDALGDHHAHQTLIPSMDDIQPFLQLRQQSEERLKPQTAGGVLSFIRGLCVRKEAEKLRPRRKKILIIGVHGWIPTKMLQTVVGAPRGTSALLCAQLKNKILEQERARHDEGQPLGFFEAERSNNPVELPEIETFGLEGAGCIEERVERYYAMLRESPKLSEADTLYVVGHSQGAVVALLLLGKLLNEGLLRDKNAGLLALAGIFHGPLAPLRDNLLVKYVEADAARELFELNRAFGDLGSRVREAAVSLLESQIRIVTVASWMDQVVPLYSSLLLGVEHPLVWRALYTDAHHYKPMDDAALAALFRFVLRLSNGRVVQEARELLFQLSDVLAGSLYQRGNPHSSIYDEPAVYQLLLTLMDEHRHLSSQKAVVHVDQLAQHEERPNPYTLPWTLHQTIRQLPASLMGPDYQRLLRLLPLWKPERKPLKLLRMQLAPLISKL